MGWVTKATHIHHCEKCSKPWTDKGYSCGKPVEADCPSCSGPPPAPKEA